MRLHKYGLSAIAALILIVPAHSQSASGSTNSPATPKAPSLPAAPSTAVIPTAVATNLVGKASGDGHAIFSLGLNWNESVRHFSVAVPNTASVPVTVLGVQPTGGLYLTLFPNTIPANGTGDFHCLLLADSDGGATVDFIKVLTTNGTIVAEVRHDRTAVAQFSATSLQWTVGGGATPQSVTLTMSPGTSVPIGVKALGQGNTASLQSTGNQRYTITVTPGSTAKAEGFPVIVSFNPKLPGVSGVIGCEIVK